MLEKDGWNTPIVPPAQPTCGSCRFFATTKAHIGPEFGDCRRHAPLIVVVELPSGGSGLFKTGGKAATQWPQTQSGEWCGDYEPTEAAIQAKRDELKRFVDEKLGWMFGIGQPAKDADG